MRVYDQYRSTDTLWLSQVPSHWEVVPLSRVLAESKTKNDGLRETNLLSLSYGRIVRKSIDSAEGLLPASFETYQIVDPDYLIFRFTDLQNDQRSLRTARVQERGIITSAYCAVKPQGITPAFAEHLMRSYDTNKVFYALGSGVRQSLNFAEVARLPVLLPPAGEQRAIADYLDRETAKIDTLIEAQQRFVELLRKRRRAVVAHAIFRGPDDAEVLPNEEPWLLPTPVHWNRVQLGYVAHTLAGWAFPSEGFSVNPDHTRLLRGVNVKATGTDWSDAVYWDDSGPALSAYRLRAGDLVMGMDRPFVGAGVRVCSIREEDLPALLLQRVLRIRPGERCDQGYMRHLMTTGAFFAYLEPLFTGVSVPHISEWQVRKFKMPLPPLDEQRRIVSYLDEQTSKIDRLIAESERLIELSRKRRSALITAAVTGQIDVRDEVA